MGVSYRESEKKRKEKRVSELVGVLVGWIDLALLVYLFRPVRISCRSLVR